MARTQRKCGRGGRFWCAFLATFASHWYSGVRFFDEILERFLNTQKRRSRRSRAELCHTRGGCPARASEAWFEQGQSGVRAKAGEKLASCVAGEILPTLGWVVGWWIFAGSERGAVGTIGTPARASDGSGEGAAILRPSSFVLWFY